VEAAALAEDDRDASALLVGNRQVEPPVVVEIGPGQTQRAIAGGGSPAGI